MNVIVDNEFARVVRRLSPKGMMVWTGFMWMVFFNIVVCQHPWVGNGAKCDSTNKGAN